MFRILIIILCHAVAALIGWFIAHCEYKRNVSRIKRESKERIKQMIAEAQIKESEFHEIYQNGGE